MSNTRAVAAIIQAISPDCGSSDQLASFHPYGRSVATYFIMDVEVLGERVASGRDRLIVGNVNGVIEVFRVYQRHVEEFAEGGTSGRFRSERTSTMQ